MADATETTQEEHADRVEVALSYAGTSQLVAKEGEATLSVFTDTGRTPIRVDGEIRDPLRFREAMSVLHDIVGSDFRYKPKDRSAYLAYQRLKKESAGLAAWQAQQAYHEWLQRNDPDAWTSLDPVVTAHPDELFVEVFSKDEGTYARLGIDWSAFDLQADPAYGTSHLDFGDDLAQGIQRMRSYRTSRLALGPEGGGVNTEGGEAPATAKTLRLPSSWVRGCLQVQSAATLPRHSFDLKPMDFYNILRHLRLNADQKRKRRGLRVELVPGEQPRVVLEPWETVFEASGQPYKGREAVVFRIWGRRRLMLVRRLLPFLESVEVHLLGSGLPSFWIFRAGPYTLTLGLTGFTAKDWGRQVGFDLLLPRSSLVTPAMKKVLDRLAKDHVASQADLAKATKLKQPEVLEALQLAALQGKVAYDIDRDVFRARALTEAPLDLARLEFRNDRERLAHDLVAEKDAVKITSENPMHGVGIEIVGRIAVSAEKREYRASLLIGEDGRVLKADCTSELFRKNGLSQGPSVPLIALRLAWAQTEAKRKAARGGNRKRVTVETRTYSRRDRSGEDVYQLSLNRTRVKIRWGRRGGRERLQQLVFNDVDAARAAYFDKVDSLESTGYLDASAS